jgi:DDE superfamily endonuclease.
VADVFNVDETGLFFNALPTTTLSPVGNVHGGKASKERVTLLVGANITGTEKLKLDLIGKSKNPRCLKNVDREKLPVVYHDQANAWMDTTIFESIMRRFNRQFALAGRKVLFLMDNCSCHATAIDLELSAVKVWSTSLLTSVMAVAL